MRKFSTKDFAKILKNNGYKLDRTNGSHLIYKNIKGRHITIYKCGKGMAPSLTQRLIKEYELKVA